MLLCLSLPSKTSYVQAEEFNRDGVHRVLLSVVLVGGAGACLAQSDGGAVAGNVGHEATSAEQLRPYWMAMYYMLEVLSKQIT
jgi:hypothetical protein